jgi:hypothetical protein
MEVNDGVTGGQYSIRITGTAEPGTKFYPHVSGPLCAVLPQGYSG